MRVSTCTLHLLTAHAKSSVVICCCAGTLCAHCAIWLAFRVTQQVWGGAGFHHYHREKVRSRIIDTGYNLYQSSWEEERKLEGKSAKEETLWDRNPRVPYWTFPTGRCYILLPAARQAGQTFCLCLTSYYFSEKLCTKGKRVEACVCAYVLVCNQHLCLCCSDMNNRSIAWWLRQIGLPEYIKSLESEYYGLEVCESAVNKCIRLSVHDWMFLAHRLCLTAGFAECNRWRAEGCRNRGCNTQRNHPESAFTIPTENGPILRSVFTIPI